MRRNNRRKYLLIGISFLLILFINVVYVDWSTANEIFNETFLIKVYPSKWKYFFFYSIFHLSTGTFLTIFCLFYKLPFYSVIADQQFIFFFIILYYYFIYYLLFLF